MNTPISLSDLEALERAAPGKHWERHVGTIALEPSFMRQMIYFQQHSDGTYTVELGQWFAHIPDVFKMGVLKASERVSNTGFDGRFKHKVEPAAIERFISKFQDWAYASYAAQTLTDQGWWDIVDPPKDTGSTTLFKKLYE